MTLLFKVIFRSVFINDLYFCRIFIQQCTCIHVYTLLICQSDFWCDVLYVRFEISECLHVSIHQKQLIYATKIIYKLWHFGYLRFQHFHCWCNLSELILLVLFITFVVIHWRCFIIMSFYQKLSLTYDYRSVLFVWY